MKETTKLNVASILLGIIVIIWTITTLSGCNDPVSKVIERHPYEIVVIEGCEYFSCQTYIEARPVLCHKGNCKNPIHRSK